MSNYEAEQEMWDAASRTPEPEAPAGLIATQSVRTRRGDHAVILTDRMVAATSHDGRVFADGHTVIWYTLGKPFSRGGTQVRYGYTRFDRAVVAERDRRASQAAWNASH